MKRSLFALAAVLLVSALSACRPAATDNTLHTRENAAQAEAAALAHAGFTADQVIGLRSEYEVDDGIPHYDVSFRDGKWEYEYEIHAQTGAVLSFHKDD